MIPSLLDQASTVRVGNLAGWSLVFDRAKPDGSPSRQRDSRTVIDHTRYDAGITLSLESAAADRCGTSILGGARATIVLEGLTDSDYALINPRAADARRHLTLHLFWRDANQSLAGAALNALGVPDIGSIAGPAAPDDKTTVAVLWVESVVRRTGRRLIEAEITAGDFVTERLWRKLATPIAAGTVGTTLKALGEAAGVAIVPVGLGAAESLRVGPFPAGERGAAAVARIATALEDRLNLHGRGMLLVRDGTLYVGKRDVPLADGAGGSKTKKDLTAAGGLIAAKPSRTEDAPVEVGEAGKGPRGEFRLTLKGRPDLKPGDLVGFDPPKDDVPAKATPGLGGALAGALAAGASALAPALGSALGAGAATLYVTSVKHQLGRSTGFSTDLVGAMLPDPAQPWDVYDEASRGSARPAAEAPSSVSGLEAAARAIAACAGRSSRGGRAPDIAEVRTAHATGTDEPPGQTSDVWRGLVAPDGAPRAARRLAPRRRSPEPLAGVPYATPFAWGRCGLVVPRYPGMRVLLVHRDDDPDDPVDVGAVFESGAGPSDAEAGDWWLVLPVGAVTTAADGLAPPPPHAGPATNDLIDAAGNRVITAGELTITVGAAALKPAGERPKRGAAGAVTITHTGGAKIVMSATGDVTITGRTVSIEATAGDITLKGANVDVSVPGQMKVHE